MEEVNHDPTADEYTIINEVLREVFWERQRQLVKWGVQDHPTGTGPTVALFGYEIQDLLKFVTDFNDENDNPYWGTILLEEVLEALAEPEGEPNLRRELIQVAAVAVAVVEDLDRKSK